MKIISTVSDLLAWRQGVASNVTIGLVPTMGYLHEGHFSLVRESKKKCQQTIVTIFVNPTQFGPQEDLASYPRDLNRDTLHLEALEVDVLFLPHVSEIYPTGFETFVEPGKIASSLCGAFRPGHFRGVLTIVLKLFNLIRPNESFFGLKDYQQYFLIKKMATDFNLPITISPLPILREPTGLAMSSRNKYLTPSEALKAPLIYQALNELKHSFKLEPLKSKQWLAACSSFLTAHGFVLDYCEIRDKFSLDSTLTKPENAMAFVAAYLGRTRLIDNMELI